ncbi:MAG: hypothetical protein MPJ24_06560 [Pirellulaceae bacterium]|nr:hypothetical protein [Pirellulaceae bacterium]
MVGFQDVDIRLYDGSQKLTRGVAFLHTPAKLNLHLEVLGRREDGFHEIETLMAAVGIYDTIYFQPLPTQELSFSCSWVKGYEPFFRKRAFQKQEGPSVESASGHLSLDLASLGEWAPSVEGSLTENDFDNIGNNFSGNALFGTLPPDNENLVFRVLQEFQREAQNMQGSEYRLDRHSPNQGARVVLHKRIPAAAGLGGASSDVAAALLLANRCWGLCWSRKKLSRFAGKFGSDIPFFLGSSWALCSGRGEKVEPLSRGFALPVVVVKPPVGLSTAEVYGRCTVSKNPVLGRSLVARLSADTGKPRGRLLRNQLQAAASQLTPWVQRLTKYFDHLGCVGHQMSGSGTSYFGICRSSRHARQVAARLRARNVGIVFCTTTLSSKKCVA